VVDAEFSPDGRSIFSESEAAIFQWDIASGESVRRYPGSESRYMPIALYPDGHSFFAFGPTYVTRWRIDSLNELKAWTFSHRYVRELTCDERKLYRLEPGCDDQQVYPTRTPYLTVQPTACPSYTDYTVAHTETPRPV
jgi:WD40 repeat protein